MPSHMTIHYPNYEMNVPDEIIVSSVIAPDILTGPTFKNILMLIQHWFEKEQN